MDRLAIYRSCDKAIKIYIDNKNSHFIPIGTFNNIESLLRTLTNISNMPWASPTHVLSVLEALEEACQFEFDTSMYILFREDVDWDK